MTVDRFNGGSQRLLIFMATALLALGLLVSIALSSGQSAQRPLDFDSTAPDGLAALRLWLQEMGFSVQEIRGERFTLPDNASLILVFPGSTPYASAEAQALGSWVESGGTLALVAVDDPALDAVFGGATGRFAVGEQLAQEQPLLPDLVAELPAMTGGETLNLSAVPDFVPALRLGRDETTLAVRRMGQGFVWRLSDYHLLTNEKLRDQRHAAAVIALLRGLPADGVVFFDAYHLFGPEMIVPIKTLQDWLYRTPLGWTTLFALFSLTLFWLLQGRRLGPPLPTAQEARRREAAEYVRAMANLQRRANVQTMVASHHKRRIKLQLGRPLRINSDQPDDEFVQRLAEAYPHLDETRLARLRRLLKTLDRPADEAALIQAVAEGDDLARW